MLKLTTKPFTSCVLCNLLIHMQNNSLRSSQMCRKQNFKVVFGFKSGTAVLTFPFCFLLPSSFPGHLVGFILEDKIVIVTLQMKSFRRMCFYLINSFLQMYSSVTTVWTQFFQLLTWLPNKLLWEHFFHWICRTSLPIFFQLWKGQLEVLMPKETVQPGHMNILLQLMPLLKIM